MRVAFHTLGCKVNQYETEAMAKMFREHQHEVVDERDFADVYIVNTCTVTAVADKKSRQYIRRMKKVNPDSIVVVTGCYAQINPEEVGSIAGVDIITGVNDKNKIVELVEEFNSSQEKIISELRDFVELGPVVSTENRTRAYIKIQEGCNRFCSYCVIPYARGPVRSRPVENIVEEAKALLNKGYKELVLTGINAAQYDMEGRDLYIGSNNDRTGCAGDHSGESQASTGEDMDEIFGIEKVISAINDLPGDFRIRLSSLEPAVVNSDYVKKLFKYDKLCHHLHMSAQSGSDTILMAMNRPYDSDGYYELVNTLFDFDPCYGISTDIIVGFPGEKDKDFKDSCDLVTECSFCKTHIFKYSKRPMTKAADMKGQISPQVKKARSEELDKVAREASEGFFEINLAEAAEGRTEQVLVEEVVKIKTGFEFDQTEEDYYVGYTGNYIRTYIPVTEIAESAINEFVKVELTEIFKDGMKARVRR
ncbi:MAG: MiaB/RimO family radical SAM methylthiotransferase [Bacillota bacterium]|nr:MiaB/RimO family radical SAM methylthiotransferase [Bacillota bacterium]